MSQAVKTFMVFIFGLITVFVLSAFKPIPHLPGKPQAVYYKLSSTAFSKNQIINCDSESRLISYGFDRAIGVKGVTYYIQKNSGDYAKKVNELQIFLKGINARFCFKESGECFNSIYFYSPKISGYSTINGTKVNVHIAFCSGGIRVGYPMIYSGY